MLLLQSAMKPREQSSNQEKLSTEQIAQPTVTLHCENERRYFVPVALLREFVDLDHLDHQVIVQSYFPKPLGEVVLALAQQIDPTVSIPEQLVVKQVRIRKSISGDGCPDTFELVVKGKHDDHEHTERDEITLRLTELTYERLVRHCSEGTVVKRRYYLPVELQATNDRTVGHERSLPELQFEIDIPLFQERGGQTEDLSALGYCIIDFEIHQPELVARMRKGDQQVTLLDIMLDISEDQPELASFRKSLSWRRIAAKGFDEKAARALERLEREYRRQRAA